MLTEQHNRMWYKWARGFHILWHGAKLVAQEVQVVLVQSDEKWFFSLVVRQFLKCIPFFGCHPVTHGVHHKNHIVLVFVMTAFMPKDNNFEQGGQSFKLLCTRAVPVEWWKQYVVHTNECTRKMIPATITTHTYLRTFFENHTYLRTFFEKQESCISRIWKSQVQRKVLIRIQSFLC